MDAMGDLLAKAAEFGMVETSSPLSVFKKRNFYVEEKRAAYIAMQTKHGDDYRALVVEWLLSDNGQHEARGGDEAKGDLLRWNSYGDVRAPSIRKDMITAAVAGQIYVRDGIELIEFISSRI